jgi:elongation factor Ts
LKEETQVAVTAELVKELRQKTGAGIMDCREALEKTEGDIAKAADFLRQKGIASADKKKDRIASEGRIEAYIHTGSKIGVLIEVNCETDFVARTEDFQNLCRELAMQVAALAPRFVSRENIPPEVIEQEREGYRKVAREEGKPEKILEKVVEGKVEKYFEGICLLEQAYIRDQSKKVRDLVKETIGRLGENIVVKRFTRYVLGES